MINSLFEKDTPSDQGIRDRAILLLMWGNALRRSEVINCDISDFAPNTGELVITGKGKRCQEGTEVIKTQ